jgi:hypothetical protein
MKTIDLATSKPTLAQILDYAGEDNVILQTTDGRHFVLVEIDDFAEEVAKVRANEKLMQLLEERSKEKTGISLAEAREQLKINTKRRKS